MKDRLNIENLKNIKNKILEINYILLHYINAVNEDCQRIYQNKYENIETIDKLLLAATLQDIEQSLEKTKILSEDNINNIRKFYLQYIEYTNNYQEENL